MLPFYREVEAPEVGEVRGVVRSFHHAQVVQFPPDYVDLMGVRGFLISDFVYLGTQVFGVFSADIGFAAHRQTRDLLSGAAFLEPRFPWVYGVMAFLYNTLQLFHELSASLVHVVVAAEGDVIGIAGVGKVESSGQSGEPAVESHGADVGQHGRGRSPLWYHVTDMLAIKVRIGAYGSDVPRNQ